MGGIYQDGDFGWYLWTGTDTVNDDYLREKTGLMTLPTYNDS
jgi:hypothetical protein